MNKKLDVDVDDMTYHFKSHADFTIESLRTVDTTQLKTPSCNDKGLTGINTFYAGQCVVGCDP